MSPNAYKNLNNPFGYNGEQYDPEAGLSYMRNRYYEPETGRFMNRDLLPGRISDPLSMNPYAYVSNNPLQFEDPLGLNKSKRKYRVNGHEIAEEDALIFKAIMYSQVKGNSNVEADARNLLSKGMVDTFNGNPYGTAELLVVHYGYRSELNKNVPMTEPIGDKGWTKLLDNQAIYHRQGKGNESNVKYISPDGREAIYDKDHNLVTDPVNTGTYNFVNPDSKKPLSYVGHFFFDMWPYYVYGNSPDDPSNPLQRVFVSYGK